MRHTGVMKALDLLIIDECRCPSDLMDGIDHALRLTAYGEPFVASSSHVRRSLQCRP